MAALARTVLDLQEQVTRLNGQIESRFHEHNQAKILLSMPGFGTLLASQFLAVTGGDITAYESAARLAGVAGLAPAPRDSGRISGITTGPNAATAGYSMPSTSQQNQLRDTAPRAAPTTNANAPKGKPQKSVLSLARRRLNVLWAMIRNNIPYQQPVEAGTSLPLTSAVELHAIGSTSLRPADMPTVLA